MKSARVSESILGNQISEPVFSSQGNLLLKEGVVVDNKVLEKLQGHDVDFVYVVDTLTYGVQERSIIEQQKIVEAVKSVKNVFEDIMENERMGIKNTIPEEHLTLVSSIVEELMFELEKADDLLYAVADLIGSDAYTYKHSVHVSILSIITAKGLNYRRKDIRNIALGALLHDIGKIRVDMNLILKPDKLTYEEQDEVQKHAEYGYELLAAVKELPYSTKQIIRLHHEKLDGSGYPLGLRGIEIPEYVRIITICDMFDAMTTDRVYREKMPVYRALDIMTNEAMYKIDAKIYNILMCNIAIYPVGTGVVLSDGSIGIVTGYRKVNPSRPQVRILTSKAKSKFISMKEINLEESKSLFIEDVWDVELIKEQKKRVKELLEKDSIVNEYAI